MSDNVTPIRPRRRQLIVKITLIVCLAVLLTAVVIVAIQNDLTDLGAVRRYFHYRSAVSQEAFGTYSYDAHNASRFSAYDDGLAVATIGGLELLDDYGYKTLECRAVMSTPAVQSKGNFILCYDVGGSTLILAHATQGKILELTAPLPLLDACMSSSGAFCYLTNQEGYKSVIPVYNENHQEIYVWYSASAFFTQCAVSPDAATLAAVSIGQDDASFHSTLQIFSTDAESAAASVDLGEQMIYDLHFLSNSMICAWGEKGLYFYRTDGKKASVVEPDEQIARVSFEGTGFVTVWLKSNLSGAQDRICTIGSDGIQMAALDVESEIHDLSVNGKYVSVLTVYSLQILDERLRTYAINDSPGAAIRVRQRSDGSVILLTSTEGELYLP
jgi:hypothetical protein